MRVLKCAAGTRGLRICATRLMPLAQNRGSVCGAGDLGAELRAELAPHGGDVHAHLLEHPPAHHAHHAAAAARPRPGGPLEAAGGAVAGGQRVLDRLERGADAGRAALSNQACAARLQRLVWRRCSGLRSSGACSVGSIGRLAPRGGVLQGCVCDPSMRAVRGTARPRGKSNSGQASGVRPRFGASCARPECDRLRGRWLIHRRRWLTTGHPDVTKRDFLKLVTGAAAAIGAAAVAWAFIDYMNPSKDVLALSSVEVDLTPIVAGQGITVLWQGKPIFVRHRTDKEIKEAEDVQLSQLIEPQPDSARVKAGPRPVDRADRHLHPSRLRAAGQQADRSARRLGRLVLPLPRQPVRHVGARAPRAGAGQSGAAALRVRVRHQDQDRLTKEIAPMAGHAPRANSPIRCQLDRHPSAHLHDDAEGIRRRSRRRRTSTTSGISARWRW